MKKFIITFIALCFTLISAIANTLKADAKTKRIAAGTIFKLEFTQPVNTFTGGQGDYFTAIIKNELKSDSSVILPEGSIVRGSISSVNTAKRFSTGAKLYLDFDHVVTPNGRQIPLDMAVCSFDNIYYDGGLYKNLGYGDAVKENYKKGVDITKKATAYGLSVRDTNPGLEYLTTPFCAVGGFFGGVGYLIGDSVADMFRKGKDVYINQGDVLEVKLINPIDVPVY